MDVSLQSGFKHLVSDRLDAVVKSALVLSIHIGLFVAKPYDEVSIGLGLFLQDFEVINEVFLGHFVDAVVAEDQVKHFSPGAAKLLQVAYILILSWLWTRC
jgi:hypothetical protein